jgi:serine/threonine protein kinase
LLIGVGAFGEVRKCQHKKIKAIRAVKILRKDALDEKEVERFIHEIDILKKLVRNTLLELKNRITPIF